jgi:hypothetical protein
MPRVMSYCWIKCKESEVWKALEHCTLTPVDPATIPGPILRRLQVNAEPDANLRYFYAAGCIPHQDTESDKDARYIAIPEDTTQHETRLAGSLWNLYAEQWRAFLEMPPEQVYDYVKNLITTSLQQLDSVVGYPDGTHGPVQRFYHHGGALGISLVQHVFNETAMPYELAIERTATVLYDMLVNREVRRTIDKEVNDRWILTSQLELLEFINAHELSQDEDEINDLYMSKY